MVGSGTNSGVPRIQHLASSSVQSPISPSTAELNMKIASVKKVQCFFFLRNFLEFSVDVERFTRFGICRPSWNTTGKIQTK